MFYLTLKISLYAFVTCRCRTLSRFSQLDSFQTALQYKT